MIDNEIDELDEHDDEASVVEMAPTEAAQIELAPVADVPAAAEEPTGPPFVLETWVLDAIEALVFASSEPLTPSRAREIIAAEMELMDNVEGKGLPTLGDMKRAFKTLLERWGSLAMREVPPPPPAPGASSADLAPLEAAMPDAAAADAPASPEAAPGEEPPVVETSPHETNAPQGQALGLPVAAVAVVAVDTSSVRGFRLVEIDGALTFRTSAQQSRFIRRMQAGKPQRLSRASLETLAVIAYRQPVTKPQVEEVRGVDSSGAVKMLLDKKLIRILGKAEEVGRPLLYGTTKTFLEFFELQSLNDLPTLKELHELEHGIDPNTVDVKDDRPAVIMDLFNADHVSAVSEETERESTEAMEALEKALGEAKDVAKRASTLVFGMQVEDGDDKPAAGAAAAPGTSENGNGPSGEPPAEVDERKDEEPKK